MSKYRTKKHLVHSFSGHSGGVSAVTVNIWLRLLRIPPHFFVNSVSPNFSVTAPADKKKYITISTSLKPMSRESIEDKL